MLSNFGNQNIAHHLKTRELDLSLEGYVSWRREVTLNGVHRVNHRRDEIVKFSIRKKIKTFFLGLGIRYKYKITFGYECRPD
jgi:hypothetical protein